MKKIITALSLYMLFTMLVQAQTIEWVKQFGGNSEDVVLSVNTDNSGNTYTTGYFAQTATFDNVTLNAIGYFNGFVTKTDPNGNILWSKLLAQPNDNDIDPYHSVIPRSISVDSNGNIIVVGYFDSGEFDADPSSSQYILSSNNYEMFILKLNPDGNFLWATSFGSTSDDFENIYDVEVDANGDIYLTGFFRNSISINHPAGTSVITSYGSSDIFVMKYAAGGYFLWMSNMGGADIELAIDLDVTPNGDVYVTGTYRETATFYMPMFDPNPVVLTTLPNYRGVFALKLDTNGNYQNVVKIGEAASEAIGMSIAADTNGYAYVTGYYGGILTANENTSNSITIDSDNNFEAFVAKVDFTNSNVAWIKEIDGGSNSVFGYAIDTDSNDNVYLSGYYSSTINVGAFNLTKQTTFAQENYLITMNSSGDFLSANQFGGINVVDTQTLKVDSNDNVILAGSFRETVDISPLASESLLLTSLGFRDNYILKLDRNNLLNNVEHQFENNVSIYPNPSEDFIYISNYQSYEELSYDISDINGKILLSGKTGLNNQINIEQLNKGLYFVSLNRGQQIFKILKK